MVTNTPKFEVQLRGGFSDRNGIKVENCALQSTEFDSRTRTAIINAQESLSMLYRTVICRIINLF